MRLKRLLLKNIRSYENQEIHFPEGAVLLAGDVGAGKTSLLLAIEYALFGLQPGQSGAALLRNNATVGEVTLELEVDNRTIIIERKLRRSAKAVTNEYAAITIDGVKVESSITELKTKILQILSYPSEFLKKNNVLYRYTVYTPQEQMKQIILEDPEFRLNILRHIFGIDKYKIMRENLNLVLIRLKDESKLLQGEIRTLDEDRTRITSTNTFLTMVQEQIVKKEEEVKQVILDRKSKENEVAELEKQIKERDKFETELEKAKVLLVSKKDQLATVARDITELGSLIANSAPFDPVVLERVLAQLQQSKNTLEKNQMDYASLKSQLSAIEEKQREQTLKKDRIFKLDFCPTCLQNVSSTHKHNILNASEQDLVDLTKRSKEVQQALSVLISSIESSKRERSILEEQKSNLEMLKAKQEHLAHTQKKHADALKSREILEKDMELLVRHLDTLKESIFKFSPLIMQHRLKTDELKQAFQNEKRCEISVAELKKEEELTKKEIRTLESAVAKKEETKKQLQYLSELNDWLANQFLNLINYTERSVMIKLRLEFSRVFSKWFHTIAGDSFTVQLDENFTPVIMQGDIEMDYTFLSGGERTAVALAYRLALNQTLNSLLSMIKTKDLVILDEPTDGFSDAQLDKVRDILEELKVEQLIVVSHEPKIESFVDHVIRLKKNGDNSRVEVSA